MNNKKPLALLLLGLLLPLSTNTFASVSSQGCCSNGGISYCDASAGRYVCNNGGYSQCLCRPSAPMDLQAVKGCCLWNGGVFKTINGEVICNDLSVSRVCSIQSSNQSYGFY